MGPSSRGGPLAEGVQRIRGRKSLPVFVIENALHRRATAILRENRVGGTRLRPWVVLHKSFDLNKMRHTIVGLAVLTGADSLHAVSFFIT